MNLKTELMIYMPPEMQAIAVPITQQYAPQMLRAYPAHMTVLSPFVPYEMLEDACGRLRAVCARIAPFKIRFSGYGYFDEVAYVAYMQPSNVPDIMAVFKVIYDEFPDCLPYGGMYGDRLMPHVTVGLFDDPAEQKAADLPDYRPITVPVTHFHVTYRSMDIRYPAITRAVIPLGQAA